MDLPVIHMVTVMWVCIVSAMVAKVEPIRHVFTTRHAQKKNFSLELSNWEYTCKYSEYNCPEKCAVMHMMCGGYKDLSCCLGMKSSSGKCIDNNCKKIGTCTNNDDICPKYGCLNGTIIYAAGQKCNTKRGGEYPNCTDGTVCNENHQICYYKYVLHSIPSSTTTILYAITRSKIWLFVLVNLY